jgi:hypothetical protein
VPVFVAIPWRVYDSDPYPVDRVSRVQAGIAVGNTGAEPFVGDKDSDRSVARLVFYPKPVSAGAEA